MFNSPTVIQHILAGLDIYRGSEWLRANPRFLASSRSRLLPGMYRTRERNSSERVLLPIGAVEIIVGGPIEDLAFLGAEGPIDVSRRGGGGPMDGI